MCEKSLSIDMDRTNQALQAVAHNNVFFAEGLTAHIHTAENYGLKHGFTILDSKGSITLTSNSWLPDQNNSFNVELYETSQRDVEVNAAGDGIHYQVRTIRQAKEAGEKQLKRPGATPEDSRDYAATY